MPIARNADYTDQTGQTISSSQVDSEMDELYAFVNNLENLLSGEGVPAGVVSWTAGATPDTGYLFCDGAAVSRTTYSDLFARIGTQYGTGDGSSTFNLPDVRGRTLVSKGTNTQVDTLGETEGLAEPSRNVAHIHAMAHTHTYAHTHTALGESVGDSEITGSQSGGTDLGAYTHKHDLVTLTNSQSVSTTSGSSITQTSSGQPSYMVLNAQIKT